MTRKLVITALSALLICGLVAATGGGSRWHCVQGDPTCTPKGK